MKFHCWWLGFTVFSKRFNFGFYVWDGYELNCPWTFEAYSQPGTEACLSGTLNLSAGPFRMTWVK